MFVTDKLGLRSTSAYDIFWINMISGMFWYVIHSHWLYVEKFLFDASYEAKCGINSRKKVHFRQSAKIGTKNISNAELTDTKSSSFFWTVIHALSENFLRPKLVHA